MKRILVILMVLLALAATPAVAQWRVDLGVNIPAVVGFSVSDIGTGESANESVNILETLTIVLPEVGVSYYGSVGPVTLGGGLRGFTFLVQTLGYPYLYAEMELGPVVGQFSVGGLLFPYFGIVNGMGAESVVIPDLSAYLKLGENFRLGAGAAALMGLETGTDAFPYLIYLSGKFVLDL